MSTVADHSLSADSHYDAEKVQEKVDGKTVVMAGIDMQGNDGTVQR